MFCIIRASSQTQSPRTIVHLARNAEKERGVLMSIMLPNLNHSFISLVPVPVQVPDPDFLFCHTPFPFKVQLSGNNTGIFWPKRRLLLFVFFGCYRRPWLTKKLINSGFLPFRWNLKGAQSRYSELFWASTKLPLNWRKSENNTLQR